MPRVVLDTSALDTLRESVSSMSNKKMQTGWFESAKYSDGTPVAGIAAQNEYGNPRLSIPPRSFIRPTIDSKLRSWMALSDSAAPALMIGSLSADQFFNALGLRVSTDIKTAISRGSFTALSPITIALRKIRNDDRYRVGGALVGAVAGAIADGQTSPGQLGDQSYGNKDPLRETSYMISTLNYELISD